MKSNQSERENGAGGLEIADQEFIWRLVELGFRLGRNNTPEQLEQILKNVPAEYRRDFLAGFHAK